MTPLLRSIIAAALGGALAALLIREIDKRGLFASKITGA